MSTKKTAASNDRQNEPDARMLPRIDPDFKSFFDDFLAQEAWLPWVERELVKLFALEESR